MTQLYWILALGLAPAILVIPRTFVGWLEQGKSAAQIFALRGKTLTFVTVWGVVACGAVALAFVYDLKDGLEVTGVVCGEFIAVCLWRDYYENHGFVTQFVKENKERLHLLLLEGLGVDEVTVESVFMAVENAMVEFWRNKLTKNVWTELSVSEMGALMFSSGLDTAKVIVEKMGDDVHWNVAAYMQKWVRQVGSVRVPRRARKKLRRRSTKMQKTLNCIAIIVANETPQVREDRATCSPRTSLPCFATARIIARKSATQGILNWPSCLSGSNEIKLRNILFHTENLSILARDKMGPCSEAEIPQSVDYTLKRMIEAGYLKANLNAKISVTVSFEDSYMIFGKDDWNQMMAIKLQPFRYITAATWMGGNPAFIVQERDDAGAPPEVGGSRSLTGTLHVEAEVEVIECVEWLQTADITDDEAEIWGKIEDFIQPKPVSAFNLLALWSIRTAWGISAVITQISVVIFTFLWEVGARLKDNLGADLCLFNDSSVKKTSQGTRDTNVLQVVGESEIKVGIA